MKTEPELAPLKFEAVMKNLQTIVQEMESGDLPLDDLISRYEEGMKLVKISRDKLAQAEQKIEILTRTPESGLRPDSTPATEVARVSATPGDRGLL